MGDCIARPRHRDEHHRHSNCQPYAMTIASGAALSPSWTVRGYCASFVPCGGRSAGGRLAVCARLAYRCAGGLPVTAQSSELARPSFFCRATRRSVRPTGRRDAQHFAGACDTSSRSTASITPRAHARNGPGPVPAAVGPGQHRVPSGPKQSFSHTGGPAHSHHA
jgi:hypothetical protein